MSGPRLSIIPAGALADVASGALKAMDLRVLCALGTHTNESGWAKIRQVTPADFKALDISMSRWTQGGWLKRVRPGVWIKGPTLADYRAQHPVNFAEIEADFDKWAPEPSLPPDLFEGGKILSTEAEQLALLERGVS